MTTQYVIPYPKFKGFKQGTSEPLVGGKLYTYLPGTTTAKTSYTDANGGTPNANPVILDSNGEADVFGTGMYKLLLTDANNVQIWSKDNIGLPNAGAAVSGAQWIASGLTPTFISATSFSFPGNQTLLFMTGMRLKSTNGGGTIYSTIISSSYGSSITTITVINDTGILDSGISAVSYGILNPQSGISGASQNSSIPVAPVLTHNTNSNMTIMELNQTIEYNSANAVSYTLLAANAVPSGSYQRIKNAGAGNLTLVGTVDGIANMVMPQYYDMVIFSDGTIWSGSTWIRNAANANNSNNAVNASNVANLAGLPASAYTVANQGGGKANGSFLSPGTWEQLTPAASIGNCSINDIFLISASISIAMGNASGPIGLMISYSGTGNAVFDFDRANEAHQVYAAASTTLICQMTAVARCTANGSLQFQLNAMSQGNNSTYTLAELEAYKLFKQVP